MKTKETQKNQPETRDPDLANAEVALRRAAIKARAKGITRKTGAFVIYSVDGDVVKECLSDEVNGSCRS
ncbi:MAG: hypothetical protein GY799_23795 [Desulfobulbaceae bacterium]|nr:hypothetical protein [Desulfobulbaceae bacterium]